MADLLLSFSGGETSAYMCALVLNRYRSRFGRIVTVFANTGQENEETLQFVDQCDKAFGFGVVWVEAEIHVGRKAPTAKVVNFETASRDGAPFEAAIAKYGIPNQSSPHCTRSLKLSPIHGYMRQLGMAKYQTAIGIRLDEMDRMAADRDKRGIIYPLITMEPTTKPEINAWWDSQPFRLRLKGYQGNCAWCWKKSMRKHMTLMRERPEIYDFPERMEAKYGNAGAMHRKDPSAPVGVFFREHRSVADLRAMAATLGPDFVPASDDAMDFSMFRPSLDVGAGCEETCEVY